MGRFQDRDIDKDFHGYFLRMSISRLDKSIFPETCQLYNWPLILEAVGPDIYADILTRRPFVILEPTEYRVLVMDSITTLPIFKTHAKTENR